MVLVSHSHKFIFLKTRKTAGTSAELALEHACAPHGHIPIEKTPTIMSENGIIGSRVWPKELLPQPALEKGMWFNHKNAADVKEDLGARRFEQYLKITTVRNPFDRCISAFHWFYPEKVRAAKTFAALRCEFVEYIKEKVLVSDRRIVFIKRKFVIDRAIRFEHLEKDLAQLATDLELTVNLDAVPHTKSTGQSRKDYAVAEYFDQNSIDIVRKRSSWVFRHFDYAEQP